MICIYCFFSFSWTFINMESENKKVWSRLETHEEWKSRIEKELRERKEQEKAKLEIENELRERKERKMAKLKKKKELQVR
jgi:C4-dicarboxylate-specific signal transduction histidine kinase